MGTRLQSNIVDVRVGKVISGSGYGNIKFSRQVAPHWIATGFRDGVETDQVVQGVAELARVDHFLVVNTGQWTSDHVADAVQCRLETGLVTRMQTINNVGGVFNFDTPQLDICTGGNVNDAQFFVVFRHAVGVESHLVGIDYAVRYLETHHELTGCALAAVQHTDVLESRIEIGFLYFFPGHFPFSDLTRILVYVDERRRAVLGQLGLLDRISLGSELNDIGR
mmetsp:Transcript_7936/g.19575  ORF Transcript_7936/g.19575 Transcript_7936/m.19575 type:complete len:223 (-) Transcript_7936:324-992(-)